MRKKWVCLLVEEEKPVEKDDRQRQEELVGSSLAASQAEVRVEAWLTLEESRDSRHKRRGKKDMVKYRDRR